MAPNSKPKPASTGLNRRVFLRGVSLAAVCSPFVGSGRAAEAFKINHYLRLIPINKSQDPLWVESLLEVGKSEPVSDPEELVRIGFPIGGRGCGSLYLRGDGKLWLWDIFGVAGTSPLKRSVPWLGAQVDQAAGANYVDPLGGTLSLAHGLAVQWRDAEGALRTKRLEVGGVKKVIFFGRYPVAEIQYEDPELPFTIRLEAFSPFLPHQAQDSSLPLTYFSLELYHSGTAPIEVTCLHWVGVAEDGTPKVNEAVLKEGPVRGIVSGVGQAEEGIGLAVRGARATAHSLREAVAGISESGGGRDGVVVRKMVTLEAGREQTVDFVLGWYYPVIGEAGDAPRRRAYASLLRSVDEVVRYGESEWDRLAGETRNWRSTWYQGSIPEWILNRVGAAMASSASNSHVVDTEGQFCGEVREGGSGQEAQNRFVSLGGVRLFPVEEARLLKVQVDSAGGRKVLVGAWDESGNWPLDVRVGWLAHVWRTYQCTGDVRWVKDLYATARGVVKRVMEVANDNGAGAASMVDGFSLSGRAPSVLSTVALALKLGEALGRVVGDSALSVECRSALSRVRKTIEECFNGDYFVQLEEAGRIGESAFGPGSSVTQIAGEVWSLILDLPPTLDAEAGEEALRSLWKFNYVRDMGPFRDHFAAGRWYAFGGDAGMVHTTWPLGGYRDSWGKLPGVDRVNEVRLGWEWLVATHMMRYRASRVPGVIVARAIHDRYRPESRNPYNAIDGGDHALSAWGAWAYYEALCGYSCNAARAEFTFAPTIKPEKFGSVFVGPEGWGTFDQRLSRNQLEVTLRIASGQLQLERLNLDPPGRGRWTRVDVMFAGRAVPATFNETEDGIGIELSRRVGAARNEPVQVLLR